MNESDNDQLPSLTWPPRTTTREIADPKLARDLINVYTRVVAYFVSTGNEEAANVWADILSGWQESRRENAPAQPR